MSRAQVAQVDPGKRCHGHGHGMMRDSSQWVKESAEGTTAQLLSETRLAQTMWQSQGQKALTC